MSELPQPLRAERYFQELDAFARQTEGVLDRLREQCADRNGSRLPCSLDAERIERRGGDGGSKLHARHVERRRQEIVGKRGIEQLAVLVADELLIEYVADTLRHAAVDLARQDQRVDDSPTVMHDHIFAD